MAHRDDFAAAVTALEAVAANAYREPMLDARAGESDLLAMDPHELRAACAALVRILEAAHQVAAAIGANARRRASDPHLRDLWVSADPPTDADVAYANDPLPLHPASGEKATVQSLAANWRDVTIGVLETLALRLAVELTQGATQAREVLSELRLLTSLEPYHRPTGRGVGRFDDRDGWWSFERTFNPTAGSSTTTLVEQVADADVAWRPRPVEALGTELDDPEADTWPPAPDVAAGHDD